MHVVGAMLVVQAMVVVGASVTRSSVARPGMVLQEAATWRRRMGFKHNICLIKQKTLFYFHCNVFLNFTFEVISKKVEHAVNFFPTVMKARVFLSLTTRNCFLTPMAFFRTNFCPFVQVTSSSLGV